jgi:hypothetical protein
MEYLFKLKTLHFNVEYSSDCKEKFITKKNDLEKKIANAMARKENVTSLDLLDGDVVLFKVWDFEYCSVTEMEEDNKRK